MFLNRASSLNPVEKADLYDVQASFLFSPCAFHMVLFYSF